MVSFQGSWNDITETGAEPHKNESHRQESDRPGIEKEFRREVGVRGERSGSSKAGHNRSGEITEQSRAIREAVAARAAADRDAHSRVSVHTRQGEVSERNPPPAQAEEMPLAVNALAQDEGLKCSTRAGTPDSPSGARNRSLVI
jgi:hypothetical protein